jgi:hypothetical protein
MKEMRSSEDSPLSPAEMLALLDDEQSSVQRKIARDVPWILFSWGAVYLLGYGALWLIDGLRPAFALPLPVSVAIFVVLLVGAIIVSAILGSRTGRGRKASSSAAFTGAVYGITGNAGFFAMYIFALALSANGMPEALKPIFFPTAIGIITAVMFLVAGAIWHAVPSVVMGGAILLVSLIAPFFGYPTHYLIFAIAGGAVFFGGAISLAMYTRGGSRALAVR